MRIVYMGSPELAVIPLKRVCEANREVVAVVSQPSRPVGRGQKLLDPAVAAYAKEKGLLVWQPESASDPAFLATLRSIKPDVVVTCAYGQILSEEFLSIPKRATINIHPSLLPKYRGATPIPSALSNEDEMTGVTVLFTIRKMDAGAIILQEALPIAESDDVESLGVKLFTLGAEVLLRALDRLSDPSFQGTPQDENRVTYCRKLSKEDGLIDWSLPGKTIASRVRAFVTWPGSYTYLGAKRIGLKEVRAAACPQTLSPGQFIYDKPSRCLFVGTGDTPVSVEFLQPEGSRMMEASAFCNGLKLNKSDWVFKNGDS